MSDDFLSVLVEAKKIMDKQPVPIKDRRISCPFCGTMTISWAHCTGCGASGTSMEHKLDLLSRGS